MINKKYAKRYSRTNYQIGGYDFLSQYLFLVLATNFAIPTGIIFTYLLSKSLLDK